LRFIAADWLAAESETVKDEGRQREQASRGEGPQADAQGG
jgi:hypothetical protein